MQRAYVPLGVVPFIMKQVWMFLFRKVSNAVEAILRHTFDELKDAVIVLQPKGGDVVGIPIANKENIVYKYTDSFIRIPPELHPKIKPLIENYIHHYLIASYLEEESNKYLQKIIEMLEPVDKRVKSNKLAIFKEMPIVGIIENKEETNNKGESHA